MSEKLDKLRASLEKEKERRIKINNRIAVWSVGFRRKKPLRSATWSARRM